MSLLEVDRVGFHYGTGTDVLRDVSVTIEPHEVVAIVGESGCGKTTLGRLVAGLVKPSSGQIRSNGADISSLHGPAKIRWRQSVQMVHQDPYSSLNPGLTIAGSLSPGILHYKLATRKSVQSEMLSLLQQVGLDATPTFLRRYPHQLSGGQRQRVAIARAISLRPELVIADEVTSMLDVSMRVAILDLLLELRQERGIGFIFVSHDFGVVRYFGKRGGRIAVMFFGNIVEEGTIEDVIRNPRHPYTQMLLQAIPIPDPELARQRSANEVDAEVSGRLIGRPATTGCVFANRCPYVQDQCRTSTPPMVEVSGEHRSACFFTDTIPPFNLSGTEEPHERVS